MLMVGWTTTANSAITSEIDVRVAAPDTVVLGDPVPIHVVATNHSAYNLTRGLKVDGTILSRPDFDVAISDVGGRRLWHRRKLPPPIPGITAIFPPGEKMIDLAPGQTLEWWAVWDQRDDVGTRVAAGGYLLTATIPEDSGIQLESGKRPITIVAPGYR
jgi:hypothetical protein